MTAVMALIGSSRRLPDNYERTGYRVQQFHVTPSNRRRRVRVIGDAPVASHVEARAPVPIHQERRSSRDRKTLRRRAPAGASEFVALITSKQRSASPDTLWRGGRPSWPLLSAKCSRRRKLTNYPAGRRPLARYFAYTHSRTERKNFREIKYIYSRWVRY